MDRRDVLKASLAVVCVAMAAQLAFGQAPATELSATGGAAGATPEYDVVSVKPVTPGGKMMMMGVRNMPDGIDAENVTVAMLVRNAYGGFMKLPTDDSMTGLPDWAKTDYFNVQAKMSGDQTAAFAKLGKDEQQHQRETMLQALLADRFKLKVHRVPKQVPDYDLVVAKGGSKLKEGGGDNPNAPKGPDGKPLTGGYLMMNSSGKVTAQQFGMGQLANFLGQPPVGLGRMVKDKTGLTGKYNFTLTFQMAQGFGGPMGGPGPPPPPAPAGAPVAAEDPSPSIFTALQEELGLKLQPSTGTIDTVVVEHVERPTAD